MIENVIFGKAIPQQSQEDREFIVYTVTTLSRNIEGYDFPSRLSDKQKKEINSKIKEFLKTLPDYDNLIDVTAITNRDNELLGLIDREIIDYDIIKFLNSKNKMVKIFFESKLKYSITTNTHDHFNVRSTFLGNGIEKSFDYIDKISILFEEYFIPYFNKNYGYITSEISTIGHGVKIRFLLNLWGLKNSSNLENILDVLSSNGVFYNHNPLYDRTNFMEFYYSFSPENSMISNLILIKTLLQKVKEIEINERKKIKNKFSPKTIIKEYQEFKNTIKNANFIHYKAFLGLMSKLSMISFFGSIEDENPIDLSEMINFLILLLRDASIMLYSNVPPTESFIGKERAAILRKFFNFT